jgi:hypothetical protein
MHARRDVCYNFKSTGVFVSCSVFASVDVGTKVK